MKYKNWIFLDSGCGAFPFEGLNDGSAVSYKAATADPPFEFERKIEDLRNAGELRNYAIVTRRPEAFAKSFIPNNVVSAAASPENVAKAVEWIFSKFGREKRGQRVFMIGDSHFYHKNIIRYCNRPWNSGYGPDGEVFVTDEDVSRMNEDMIARWNDVVSRDDIVYSTGDFCFGSRSKVESVFPRLNGRKRIVLGNHDRLKFKDYYEIGFERVYDHPIIIRDFIILSHEPLQWVKDGSVYLNIYAHVHDQEMYKDYTANTFCSSAERIDHTPIELDEIIKRCQTLQEK